MALDELKEGDEKESANGIDVIYNKDDEHLFYDAVIDYVNSDYERGFIVSSETSSKC